MKYIFVFLLLVSGKTFSQFIVVDQALKIKINTESPERYDSRKHFVFHQNDTDTITYILTKYLDLIKANTRANFAIREEIVGKSVIRVKPVSKAYADRYELSIETRFDKFISSILLSDNDDKNRDNARRIMKFIQLVKE